jgi:streptothricin acetyltransferase
LQMALTIVEEGFDQIAAYGRVPIAFEASCRLDTESLKNGIFEELPMEPRLKDYDAFADEQPSALPRRFEVANWTIFSAIEHGERLGGVIVARDTPGFDMLEERKDLAVLVDLRVGPRARGRGVGSALVETAEGWARGHGCVEMIVETQDVNVAACRFYHSCGFEQKEINVDAYGPAIDEIQLIWRKTL